MCLFCGKKYIGMSPATDIFIQFVAVLTPVLVIAFATWVRKTLTKFGLLDHDPAALADKVKELQTLVDSLTVVIKYQREQIEKGTMLSDRDTSLVMELKAIMQAVKKQTTPPNTPGVSEVETVRISVPVLAIPDAEPSS